MLNHFCEIKRGFGSGIARRASGARALGRRSWGRISTLFCSHLKRVLSKNLDQSTFKNAYFLEKYKNRLSIGGSAPEPPYASGGWGLHPQTPGSLLTSTIQTLSCSFLAFNAFHYPRKRTK